jgi:uncharacterized tellurite resistance protein B-like protein
MDYFLLPDKIKSQLPPPGDAPPEVLNASGGLDGASGDCYLVADSSTLRIFARTFGEDAYKCFAVSLGDPSPSLSVRKEKFNSMLDVSCAEWRHSLRFSSFDIAKLEALAARFQGKGSAVPSAISAAETAPTETSPFVGLLASLMFVASHDGSIDAAEDLLIKSVAGGDDAALSSALALYRACEPNSLASALSALASDDRLCIVANMLDVAMSDGVLKSSEQRFISGFASSMGVSQDEYGTLRDALFLKARVALLKGWKGAGR